MYDLFKLIAWKTKMFVHDFVSQRPYPISVQGKAEDADNKGDVADNWAM